MLRLKGQTESGEIINFNISDILGAKSDYIALNGRHGHILLLTESVQPADDPRKHPMFTITCPNCDYEYMDPFEDGSFECPECELYLPPKKDQRKAMLDEIREKINNLTEYKTFVRVEGDPVPTLPQIAKWCVIWILDEMEAKL